MNRSEPRSTFSGPLLADRTSCTGCSACQAVCPKTAISMRPDAEGFLRPQVDPDRCIGCYRCEQVCPVLHPAVPDASPTCYAAYSKATDLRMQSSSGGLFSELARPILAAGGLVFGCVWEKPDFVAVHRGVDTLAGLADLRGAKYVQSDLRDTFREARRALEAGRPVLFSGMPCQIAGLHAFLTKPYVSLLTVELICHGGPSPAVWEIYKQQAVRLLGPLTDVCLKDKQNSWRRYRVTVRGMNGARSQNYEDDVYMQAFLKNLCLRPSCYACPFRSGRSGADMTLGDFWGIESVLPKPDDDRGISAVLIHTARGMQAWSACVDNLNAVPVTQDRIVAGNPVYTRSVTCPSGRRVFMRRYASEDWSVLLNRATRLSPVRRIWRSVRVRLGRLLKGGHVS